MSDASFDSRTLLHALLGTPTVESRSASGKAARKRAPRATQLDLGPEVARENPIELLVSQSASRVEELVPLRYARMAVSPFTYYRGAALPMAADLSLVDHSGLTVQLCGDAHLANFGAYASPERELLFDLNDFDETHPGPFEWDVKRLVASIVVCGQDRNFDRQLTSQAVRATVNSYSSAMATSAEKGFVEQWHDKVKAKDALAEAFDKLPTEVFAKTEKTLANAPKSNSLKAFAKLTEVVDGVLRFKSDPPVLTPLRDLFTPEEVSGLTNQFEVLLSDYLGSLQSDRQHLLSRYRLRAAARKVVGVGSVGTRAWVLLLTGRDDTDVLLLQAKEANASVLERYTVRSEFAHHGQRVVVGQHLLQAASDPFLGFQRMESETGHFDYYVRQLRDWKTSVDLTAISAPGLVAYGEICGQALARAHVRTGDSVAISAYLGTSSTFADALVDFAHDYAERNETDYEAFCSAIARGDLPVAAAP
jgi:uncharacterized protein (DUF2252 family)